mmetsp:Transcript_12823/g.25979  ORF Transcript_12823/g.25979 Transcript_12823/m.25979 type:complete len:311 (+) Transcript_12823:261-1193(+)
MHQHGFFEGLLGAPGLHDYLGTVSRSHFEISPAAAEAPGAFEVTNLSGNPLVVHYRRLGNGERAVVRVGDSIDFIRSGPDGSEVVFLTFRLETLAGEGSGEALGMQAPPTDPNLALQSPPTDPNMASWKGSSKVGSPSFRLVATQAYGLDVMALTPDARIIAIPADGQLAVGRQHQLGFFEALLSDSSAGEPFICRVSRSHLQLALGTADKLPGCFTIKNISSNPVVLCDWSAEGGPQAQQLDQGDHGTLRPGDSIDFVAARPDGAPGSVVYLQLCLEPDVGPPRTAAKVRSGRNQEPRRRRGDWDICCA